MDVKNQLEFFLFRGLVAMMRLAPGDATRDLLARLAIPVGRFPGLRRQVVLEQLAMVFPGASKPELAVLADRIYDHLGRTVAEVFGPRLDDYCSTVAVVPGWGPVHEALSRGKGAIVATGHIGNFELGGAVLARHFPLLDVVKPQRNPLFDKFINDARARRGILTVPMDSSGLAVVRHLREGGVVSVLRDQDAGADGLEVDFLGHPASTWPGAARLSIRTGCPVVPLAILRQDDGTHRLVISDPLDPTGLDDTPADVQGYLQRISSAVEGFIKENPEQWFWVHRRWKGGSECSSAGGT